MEHSPKLNGYKPKSFGDVALIVTFICSGLIWGIKLELNQAQIRQNALGVQRQVDLGVLPRADERIRRLENEVVNLKQDFQRQWEQHDRDYPPQWLVNEVEQIEKELKDFKKFHEENFTPAKNLEPRK